MAIFELRRRGSTFLFVVVAGFLPFKRRSVFARIWAGVLLRVLAADGRD